jgi:YfiH family protein
VFASRDRIQGAAGVVEIGFTDRHGGVSAPPFDSLDLSLSATDRAEEVAANLSRVAAAFGVDRLAVMRQRHGADAVVVESPDSLPECDALVTTRPGLALCVRVADCVPVLLADADRGVVGAAHAGRSGVVAGVVPTVVRRMRDLGAEHLTAWIGPHVCGGCYEVPASMRGEVVAVVPAAFAVTTWGTPSLDLGAAVQAQLADQGVQLHDLSRCTRESPELYSHRRDGSAAGRLGGVVVLREAGDG